MEWWIPFAVFAAALLASMIAPMPLPRSRRSAGIDRDVTARPARTFKALDRDDEPPRRRAEADRRPAKWDIKDVRPERPLAAARAHPDDPPPRRDDPRAPPTPQRARSPRDYDDDDAPPPMPERPPARPRREAPPPRPARGREPRDYDVDDGPPRMRGAAERAAVDPRREDPPPRSSRAFRSPDDDLERAPPRRPGAGRPSAAAGREDPAPPSRPARAFKPLDDDLDDGPVVMRDKAADEGRSPGPTGKLRRLASFNLPFLKKGGAATAEREERPAASQLTRPPASARAPERKARSEPEARSARGSEAETMRRDPPPPPRPPSPAARKMVGRRSPVMDRPGVDSPSYFRDPLALKDWPQAKAVEETVRAFLDRWGGSGAGAPTFRKVEVVPGSNERAFAYLLAVEPERKGSETTLLARVCVPAENAERPSRFWATKYFDHIGARFREDVTKTPQHSRGIIMVRDVPPDEAGRGAVALDYEVTLRGDPYDDIRSDDVAQYKNLLNIMRMFA